MFICGDALIAGLHGQTNMMCCIISNIAPTAARRWKGWLSMYLIDASKTEWYQIQCTDGNTYVLIKKKHLFDLPKVDAEPVRHARWEKDQYGRMRCTLCGTEACINRFGTGYVHSRYCPSCGAKMDGGMKDG